MFFFRLIAWAMGLTLCLHEAGALDPARSVHQYNCQTWRRANGLPANAVTAVAQSADGRVWLGTSQGLVQFDGVSFRTVLPAGENADVDSKVMTALAPRKAGGLWFGLERRSFGYFENGVFTPLGREEWGGSQVTIRSLQLTRDGELLVGGTNLAGRLRDGTTMQSFLPVRNADVFSLHEDADGRIWIGTADQGLFYFADGRLNAFPAPELRGQVVSAVAVDHSGLIWVGTPNGLRCYNAQFEEQAIPASASQPRALLVDRHGVLWIGTISSGLIRHHNGVFTALSKQDGLASDRVLSLAESDDGSLWIGTEEGLSQLTDVKFPILSLTEGLSHEACLAVAMGADGSVWAATPNGLSRYRDGRFTTFGVNGADGFTSRWIKRVFAARNGDVYLVGARKNLDRFSGGRVVQSWPQEVWPRVVSEDSKGILVVVEGRLLRLEEGELRPYLLADGSEVSLRWISDLVVDAEDSIWIAAVDGVFEIEHGVLHNRCHENGVYRTAFYYLWVADDGAVWAAQNTGIARFKAGGMATLTRAEGLHENFVYAIVGDRHGQLWLDSSRGLFRMNEAEANAVADGRAARVTCEVFDGEDAVKTTDKSAQEYSGGRSADGKIWFPSSKGLVMIDPANVPRDDAPPRVSIDRVMVDGREYPSDREPHLAPTAGNLEFHYAALNYRAPLKTRYRYRLEGYETDWVDAGDRRSAFYTNLAHGRYRFQVQACNADGVWNTTGASFAVTLPARYHETGWFRVLCGVAVVGLGAYGWWMIHLRRKHAQLRQTRDLLEAKVEERTRELRAQIAEREKVQEEVERVHRELMEISRQAGMAEVATGVLHNVGNVLTSLNVSATLLHDRIADSKVAWIAQLRDLLHDHAGQLGEFLANDPRGRQVPGFVATLAGHLAAEQRELMAELASLRKNVEHINDIVAMQQNYARVSGVTERVAVTELIEDALRMNEGAFARHAVTVVRDYQARPLITVEKHKVLQILVNLLRNAKYACEEAPHADRRIVVRLTARAGGVQIAVIDNGVGIARENLTRIFSHGFTTRKSGHGFGLHNGALGARNLGGALTVHSDGPGRGATFTLELPEVPPAPEE